MGVVASDNNLSLLGEIFRLMLIIFTFNQPRSDIVVMNRIQFFILTGLSGVFALLLIGHIALSVAVGHGQAKLAVAQQVVQQGNVFQGNLKQLAVRIYQDSQRTSDSGLKDILAKHQITYAPGTNGTETPATPSSK